MKYILDHSYPLRMGEGLVMSHRFFGRTAGLLITLLWAASPVSAQSKIVDSLRGWSKASPPVA